MMFETLDTAPPDAILGLGEAFQRDPNPNKINLSVGVFKNAEGKTGWSSIPYDGIRDTCNRSSDGVKDWCKSTSRPISCDDFNPAGLTRQIENVKGKIADLKRERDELS